jgi:hypothetical protein
MDICGLGVAVMNELECVPELPEEPSACNPFRQEAASILALDSPREYQYRVDLHERDQ